MGWRDSAWAKKADSTGDIPCSDHEAKPIDTPKQKKPDDYQAPAPRPKVIPQQEKNILDLNQAMPQRIPKEDPGPSLEIQPMTVCLDGVPCSFLRGASCRKAGGASVFSLDACPLPGKKSRWFKPNEVY